MLPLFEKCYSIFFLLYFILASCFFVSLTATATLLTFWFDKNRRIVHYISCFWGWHYFLVNPFWKFEVEGRENIDPNKTYILIANHASYFDILAMYGLFRQFKFVSKETIFRIPLIGWNMYLNQYVKIKRGNMSSIKEMMATCREWLKQGASVMMFPEGTRTENGDFLPFRNGSFTLSLELGIPVVPIVIYGTYEVFPKNRNSIHVFQPVKVKVLPPMDPKDYEGKPGKMKDDAVTAMLAVHDDLRKKNAVTIGSGEKAEQLVEISKK